jgi:hypothetical protein
LYVLFINFYFNSTVKNKFYCMFNRKIKMNHLNILRKLPLVIALSIGLAACNEENTPKDEVQQPVPTPSANVALQVFDNSTGAQVSTAQVSVVGSALTTSTNVEGKAQLQKVAVGRSVIKISKMGYADQFITVDLADKQELTGVVIQLIPLQFAGAVSALTGGTINLTASTAQVVIAPNSYAVPMVKPFKVM